MKTTLQKLACLLLALSLILAASGAMATQHAISSAQWETIFKGLLDYSEEKGLPLSEHTDFTVSEFTAPNGETGYEHSLDLIDSMRVYYYDDGNDADGVFMLTIKLDQDDAAVEVARLALYFTVFGVDNETSLQEFNELMDAMCPIFDAVFAGEERVSGLQTASMRGIGYALEINDTERLMTLYANVSLTSN